MDFSTLRGNIQHDLGERDFTINAVAIDTNSLPAEGICFYGLQRGLLDTSVIDPFNGQIDLQGQLIKVVSSDVFDKDPVRLLRALRLAAELDFTIDTATQSLIKEKAALAVSVAGERVRDELLKLLKVPGSSRLFKDLDDLGLLLILIPELAAARETTQPVEHHWKVLEHSLNTAVALDFLTRQGAWLYEGEPILASVPWSEQIAAHLNENVGFESSRLSLLKLAAVLHDIAKPQTKGLTPEGRTRFIGHDREGAAISETVLERLRFSTKEIKLIGLYVRYHLRPTQLTQVDLPTRRAIYRYFRDTDGAALDVLYLSLADHLATRGPDLELRNWEEHTKLVDYVISQYYRTEELVKPPKLVDGNDLINIFGLKPGPELGVLLEDIKGSHWFRRDYQPR